MNPGRLIGGHIRCYVNNKVACRTVASIEEVENDGLLITADRICKFSKSAIPRTERYMSPFTHFECRTALVIGAPTQICLPERYEGERICPADCPKANPIVAAIMSFFLNLISAVFVKYGTWNLYHGPCDWRGVSSLWIGWVPFAIGCLIFVSCVFPG